jgi:hypothetical protein
MRNQSGGFINPENVWDIGSPDRGRDGDNVRFAAKKYNDHRHSAISLQTTDEVNNWLNEKQSSVLVGPDGTVQGGILTTDNNVFIRRAGDLAVFGGILWVYDGAKLVPVGVSGVYFDSVMGVVNTVLPIEYQFNSYKLVDGQLPPDGASVKTLVGTVVIDYSKLTVANTELQAEIEIVASVNDTKFILDLPAIINNADILNEFNEGNSLALYAGVSIQQQVAVGNRFTSRDTLVMSDDINAYASNGDEIINASLDYPSNQVVKYNLYIQTPSIDEYLSRNPDIANQLTVEQKTSLQQLIASSEVQLSKASIRINIIYGV